MRDLYEAAQMAESEYNLMEREFNDGNIRADLDGEVVSVLTEDEAYIYKRGRNAKVNSVPQKADIAQYHAATGLEALFGWLYLQGKTERINELYAICTEDSHGA